LTREPIDVYLHFGGKFRHVAPEKDGQIIKELLMSDQENETSVGEEAAAAAPAKAKTEKESVTMTDGRKVEFAGKRKMLKDVIVGDGGSVSVRFDFRNGETRTFAVPSELLAQFAGHGASQKIGDETAGVADIDDMVVGVDTIIARLSTGQWAADREEGDGFSGASIVIKAIVEASGKDVDTVKAFLQSKLDQAAAKGEKLTRQALYKSFRNPATKTGAIIQRLEFEKASKNAGNSDALLAELG